MGVELEMGVEEAGGCRWAGGGRGLGFIFGFGFGFGVSFGLVRVLGRIGLPVGAVCGCLCLVAVGRVGVRSTSGSCVQFVSNAVSLGPCVGVRQTLDDPPFLHREYSTLEHIYCASPCSCTL